MEGEYQNNIDKLSDLDKYRLENIFKIYQDDKTYYYYNILKNIAFPTDMDTEYYTIKNINFNKPLTLISNELYGTIELWWLILVVNNIFNPFISGVHSVKIIKPKYINNVLDIIQSQL